MYPADVDRRRLRTRSTWRKALETGDAVVVLQTVPKPFPDLPNLPNVPLAIDLAKTDGARQMIEVGIHTPGLFARPLVLPPGTPKEWVQFMSTVFQETLKDKEFLAEVEKGKLGLDPVTGEELKKAVARIFKIEPSLQTKLRDILFK